MALSTTTRARLQTLLDFLRTVEPDRLRMRNWTNMNEKAADQECGFAGCAIGWAGQIPEFNVLGFTCERSPYFTNETTVELDWCAVQAFFEIRETPAEYLFGAWTYNREYEPNGSFSADSVEPGHENVLKRIQHFLDTDGELAYWVGQV